MAYYAGEIVKLRDRFLSAHRDGDYLEAIALGEKIISLYKSNNDEKSLAYANDLNNLAIVYDDTGSFKKALAMYKQAAAIKKDVLGENAVSYGDTLNNIAVILNYMQRHKAAAETHKKVYGIRADALGKTHVDTILSLYNLGNSYEDLRDYDKAVEYHSRALKLVGQNTAIKKGDLADIHIGLGNALSKSGLIKEGSEEIEKAAVIIKEYTGENNFMYMTALLYLAKCWERGECYKEAAKYYKKAIFIRAKILEKTHIDYVTTLNALCRCLEKTGDYEEVLKYIKETRLIIEDIMGKEHLLYGDSLLAEGRILSILGKHEEGLKLALSAVNIKHAPVSGNKGIFIDCYTALGGIYESMGNYEKALKYYMEAIDERKKLLGDSGFFQAVSVAAVGSCYMHMGEYEKSQMQLNRALNMAGASGGRGRYRLSILNKLANCHFLSGNSQKALEISQMAVSEAAERFSERSPVYAKFLLRFALIEDKCGDLDSAISNTRSALKIRENVLGEDASPCAVAREKLARLYMKKSMYPEAIDLFELLADEPGLKNHDERLRAAQARLYIAKIKQKISDSKTAFSAFNKALYSFEKFGVTGTVEYSRALSDFGAFMECTGRDSKASEILEKAFALKKSLGKFYDRETADVLENLSRLYIKLDYHEKVVEVQRERLEILKEGAFCDDKEYSLETFRVGELLCSIGKNLEGMACFMEALNFTKALFGEGPEYADILVKTAEIHKDDKKFKDALKIYERAGEIYKFYKGAESSEYIGVIAAKASVFVMDKQVEKAMECYEQIYKMSLREGKKELMRPEYLEGLTAIYLEKKDLIKLAKVRMGREI